MNWNWKVVVFIVVGAIALVMLLVNLLSKNRSDRNGLITGSRTFFLMSMVGIVACKFISMATLVFFIAVFGGAAIESLVESIEEKKHLPKY